MMLDRVPLPKLATSPRGWHVIACDLDGTLVGRGQAVQEADLAALRRAVEAGLHVAIATGRNSSECREVIAALGLRGPGVFVNGAVICEQATQRSTTRHFLTREVVDEAATFFGELGHAVLALADDPETGLPVYVRTERGPVHRATEEWLVANRMHAMVQAEIEPRLRDRIVRTSIVVDVPEALPIERALAARFGDRVNSHSIYSGVYDCQVIELFPAGATKWTGIEAMCAELGVSPERVVTVGDDVNDLAMLEGARLSFAMGTASPVVRAAAKRVTGTLAECGVARVVEGVLNGEW